MMDSQAPNISRGAMEISTEECEIQKVKGNEVAAKEHEKNLDNDIGMGASRTSTDLK